MAPADSAPGGSGWSPQDRISSGLPGRLDDAGTEAGIALLHQFSSFLMIYKFAVDEIVAKLRVWSEEFDFAHEHVPIEHITHRVKKPEAIVAKLRRRSLPLDPDAAKEHLEDIAGVRVVCPFVSDVYRIRDLLVRHQTEVTKTKDYIATPKPNGYRSLHLIVKTPVHLSDRTEHVTAELQLRTIAMDFWAALEHELFYKCGGRVPADFADELKVAAETAAQLDTRMESLYMRSQSPTDTVS